MDDRAVDRLMRSALDAGRPDAGPHPEPDTLFAYYALDLSAEEAERVQSHLALCRECAVAVADLEVFPALDPPSDDDLPSEADLAAGWAEVKRRLATGEGAETTPEVVAASVPERPRVPLPFTPPVSPGPGASFHSLRAAAAVLAVTAMGAAFVAYDARRDANKSAEPHEAVAELVLNSDAALPGSAEQPVRGAPVAEPSPAPTLLASDTKLVIVRVMVAGLETPPPYRVELCAADDARPCWTHELRRVRDGELLFTVAPQRLPIGRGRLRLFSSSNGEKLGEYTFEIESAP